MFERSEFVSHPTGARLIWGPAEGGQRLCGRLLFGYFFLAKQEKVTGCRATPASIHGVATVLATIKPFLACQDMYSVAR